MIKNIFFDFDGVLVESVSVKSEAFRKLYEFAGNDISDKVVEYHLANGGVSRFDKIKYYHREFLGIELSDKEVLVWAEKFSSLALSGVLESPEIDGAHSFLKENYGKYRFWVITGTPTTEIKEILEKKEWASFFLGAYGSPEKKKHWTEYLINTAGLNRRETLFIGDAPTDLEAANHSGLNFILRKYDQNEELFEDYKGLEMSSFVNIENLINSIK